MLFTSDNIVGASPKVLEAIVEANAGALPSYGADDATKRLEKKISDFFERPCSVFLVTTGTAANALAASAIVPPYAALICHEEAHIIDDECGAPEFFMGGGKLVGIRGAAAKLTPQLVQDHLDNEPGGYNHPPFRGLSLSQATECGTIYQPDDISAIAGLAHANGMKVHMDGARFFNALATLKCSPAEMTWKAGVDLLSLGGTKNGCLLAEAVVIFDRETAVDFGYRRKRAGQTLSKHRLITAQFEALLKDDHWLALAAHANLMAQKLSNGLATIPSVRIAWPTQANEVFAILPQKLAEALRAAGAGFFEWTDRSLEPNATLRSDERVNRFVCSFASTEEQVGAVLDAARSINVQAA